MKPLDESAKKDWTEIERERLREDMATLRKQEVIRLVPPKYRGGFDRVAVELPRLEAERKRCQAWADAFGPEKSRGLYFSGPTGSGKTALAMAIAEQLIMRGRKLAVWNYNSLMHDIRASIKDANLPSENELIAEATQADLLVLDDLGAEKQSEYSTNILYLIVSKLYDNNKLVIVTSNYGGKALLERLEKDGDTRASRIVSRLCEMVESVKIRGVDLRIAHARKSGGAGVDVPTAATG